MAMPTTAADRDGLEPARRGLAFGRGEIGVRRLDPVALGARPRAASLPSSSGELAQRAARLAVRSASRPRGAS